MSDYKKYEKGFINYAHRGASEYLPENTLLSFYTGVYMKANGIETDVRHTKDGTLVLFHDNSLERVTGDPRSVEECTLAELMELDVKKDGYADKIVVFEDFLKKFAFRDIVFAIELKGADVEAQTLEMAKEFGIMEKTTFTSFAFEYIQTIKKLEPTARVGWLTSDTSDGAIERLLAIGGEEMAPKASTVTEELMKKWRGAGLGVRAWGVTSIELMKQMCHFGVDGMTVNFPDRLQQYCC